MSQRPSLRVPSAAVSLENSSREPSPTRSGSAAASSETIWSFFRLAEGDEIKFHETSTGRKHRKHYCSKCDPDEGPVYDTSWTSNAKTHPLSKHGIDVDSRKCFLWTKDKRYNQDTNYFIK
jgi:hypothetical protein